MVINFIFYFKKSYWFFFISVERVNILLDIINNMVGNFKKLCNYGIFKSENDNLECYIILFSDIFVVLDFLNKMLK